MACCIQYSADLVFCFEERSKYPFLVIVAYADAGVYDVDLNVYLPLIWDPVLTLGLDFSVLRRELDSVRNQVQQNLHSAHQVHLQLNVFACEFDAKPDAFETGLPHHHGDSVAQHLFEGELLKLGHKDFLIDHTFVKQKLYLRK